MTDESPNTELLLPDRHPQYDLFVCDVADAVLKDDQASMEHPFFSLKKTPDTQTRKYEHNGNWIEIVPSVKGLATIYDKDILIYCISQIIAKLNQEGKISRRVKIVAKDLLIFTNRTFGGKDYEALRDALERLDGTRIRTNIETGNKEEHRGFGLIEHFKIVRSKNTGRILSMEIMLSEWVYNAIQAKEVLTLHKDYFRLKKPLERRIYEIARKHCGRKQQWSIGFELLKKKTGSTSEMKEFKRFIRKLVLGDHLPDYSVSTQNDKVVFHNRDAAKRTERFGYDFPILQAETYEMTRAAAHYSDVYYLEQEWPDWWVESGKPELFRPDKECIGLCKLTH